MELYTVALFGEAEKGDYQRPSLCKTVEQLRDLFGNPPIHSKGIYYAIQALLYKRALLYFRVKEEGFSYDDYVLGLNLLKNQIFSTGIHAVYLPGVGSSEIIGAIEPICEIYHSLLITNESDFYDYLTEIQERKNKPFN